MNDAPNFSSILDEAPTEVERPLPLPIGTYLCIVAGQPNYDKTRDKGTEYVEFTLKPIAAMDDVDNDDLEAVGGFENKTLRRTFYITPDAIYRLDEFHEHCGLDLNDPASRKSRNNAVVNAEVYAVVKHQDSKDRTTKYAVIDRTASAA